MYGLRIWFPLRPVIRTLACSVLEVAPREAIASVSKISAVPMMLRVITEVTGLRLSLIAHVTDSEWTCCAVNDQLQFGLEKGGTLELATTLCSEVRSRRQPIVISHATQDPRYRNHHTPKLYNIEAYIAVPIFMPDGAYFGNVCALDSRPVDLSQPRTLGMFQLFAELVGLQLAAEARHDATSSALLDATQAGELREQFIAVLGHDVRTPLQSIAMGNALLSSKPLPDWTTPIITRMKRSTDRIMNLVDDVVDFTRGRLGGGIAIQASEIPDVLGLLAHVVDELRVAHPERDVTITSHGSGSMRGDPVRLAQLLQNLLANALVHSPPRAPVSVVLELRDQLSIAVTNGGPAIPDDTRAKMFEPYRRGTSASPGGLGLGLYIASQIVRSHGGAIGVSSSDGATTFRCTIPR
jgi:signal transduction histidine kinase